MIARCIVETELRSEETLVFLNLITLSIIYVKIYTRKSVFKFRYTQFHTFFLHQ